MQDHIFWGVPYKISEIRQISPPSIIVQTRIITLNIPCKLILSRDREKGGFEKVLTHSEQKFELSRTK